MKQHCKRVKAEATDILRPASEMTVTSATLHWPKGHRARPDLRGGELGITIQGHEQQRNCSHLNLHNRFSSLIPMWCFFVCLFLIQ